MSVIEWEEPPPRPQNIRASRCRTIKSELMERPQEWAVIARQEPTRLFPWWGPLHDDPQVEMRIIGGKGPFDFSTPRDIYARYIGPTKEDMDSVGE